MPATTSEAKQLRTEGQMEGFNLMLTLVSKLTEWSDQSKQWMGLAGDIDATHRIARGDFANTRKTKIENKLSKAIEQIRYHMVEAEKFTGRERENHLEHVQTYLKYIRRLAPASNETERLVANVWPWPQMMRAAMNITGEGGTSTLVSPGLSGLMNRLSTVLKGADAPPPPPPALPVPLEGEEGSEAVEVDVDPPEDESETGFV